MKERLFSFRSHNYVLYSTTSLQQILHHVLCTSSACGWQVLCVCLQTVKEGASVGLHVLPMDSLRSAAYMGTQSGHSTALYTNQTWTWVNSLPSCRSLLHTSWSHPELCKFRVALSPGFCHFPWEVTRDWSPYDRRQKACLLEALHMITIHSLAGSWGEFWLCGQWSRCDTWI